MKIRTTMAALALAGSAAMTIPAPASAEPFVGETRMVGYTWCPRGWAEANGQLLAISQNSALFSLLGTTYGGDGRTTFGLPDLRGRLPIHTDGNSANRQGSTRPGGMAEPSDDGSGVLTPGTQALHICIATVGVYPSRN